MEYPSKLIEEAMDEMIKLPGIGKRTAMRMILHLIKENKEHTAALTSTLNRMRENIIFCIHCWNISDEKECRICKNPRRNRQTLCVVEDTRDVLAIENTQQYNGLYHVLGGLISPMNGVGPSALRIDALISRLTRVPAVEEVILALSPTMEGDTTAFYISKKLKQLPIKITTIARGIPIGGNLEFADEITLGRSILARTVIPS